MKTKVFTSGLIVGTLTLVAGKAYLSYRYYNLQEIDLDDNTDKQNVNNIITKAKKYCKKVCYQLWAY